MLSTSTKRRLLRALPSFEEEMLLLRHLVRPGDTVLDIGASYGLYAVWLAWLAAPAGTVHAFEPRPRSRLVLRAVRRAFAAGAVRVHPVALADRDGEDVIVTPRRRWYLPVPGRSFLKGDLDGGPGGDRYYEGWDDEFGGATERPVPVRTVDAIVAELGVERVAFVKIDVEGAELRVLEGATRTLATHRPAVLCEIEDRHTRKYGHPADDIPAWFAARGYVARAYGRDGLEPADRIVAEHNNYLFLPAGHPLA